MATTLFDRPLFVQRQHFIEEIATLEDAFDLLEAWPADRRGLAYEVLIRACHDAAGGRFPLGALRTNLERFLRKAGMSAVFRDLPSPGIIAKAKTVESP